MDDGDCELIGSLSKIVASQNKERENGGGTKRDGMVGCRASRLSPARSTPRGITGALIA